MSILNVNTIQPIGSGTTITVAATELKTSNFITVGTGASVTSPSANVLTLGTNNAERFRIASNGNTGIGTNNPGSNKLQIQGSSAFYGNGGASATWGDTSYLGALSFDGSAQPVIRAASSKSLIFQVNQSTEALRITSGGDVSIGGLASPRAKLDIEDAGTSKDVILRVSADDNNPYALVVANDTFNTTSNRGFAFWVGSDKVHHIEARTSTTNSENEIMVSAGDAITFRTNVSEERLRITSSGMVGIGTDTPGTALEVSASGAVAKIKAEGQTNARVRIEAGNTSSSYLEFGDSDDSDVGEIVYDHSDNSMRFRTAGTPHVYIDSSGRMLLGTDSAFASNVNAKLQVRATSDAPQILFGRNDTTATTGETLGILSWYGNDGGSYQECASIRGVVDANHANNDKPTRISFYVCRDNSGSITESWRLRSDGGTQNFATSTNYDLSNTRSAGNTYEFIYARNNSGSMGAGTLAFKVTSNGNVSNTNNSYGSLSDQRLKENIVDATSQWDDIKGLQIRKYNFRENTGYETHTQIGLIAQEAESISPGLVETSAVKEGETVLDADGNQLDSIKSINYSVLYMKSVKALQEAQTRIEALETQNADLLARVTALEGS